MPEQWTDEGSAAIGEIARRHGFSDEAGRAMADALNLSAGSMAQFHHPDLGGMGQWSRGGMLMIGDMFNHHLKGRVAGLAEDLAEAMVRGALVARRPAHGESSAGFGQWWPESLGHASSTGAQNGGRYAVFPDARRLAVKRDGRVTIYDTGDHRIGGASQQQGGGSSLSFSTDRGSVGIEAFSQLRNAQQQDDRSSSAEADPIQHPASAQATAPSAPAKTMAFAPRPASNAPHASPGPTAPPAARAEGGDPFDMIRKLASLKDEGLLTEEEFAAKKTELLARI